MIRYLSIFILAILGGACTNIAPGHVGIRVNKCSGGGVDAEPLPVGYHGVGPCIDIEEYPTYMQTLVLTASVHEGKEIDESIHVPSYEGLDIGTDVALNFSVEAAKAPAIYSKFRKDLEHIQHTYIRQAIREALQESFSKYTAEQIYSTKRQDARVEIEKTLRDKLGKDGFVVQQFTISETRVPKQVTDAINGKVAMVQDAQRSEKEVQKTRAVAEQLVAKAEGEARARRMQADAEAYYNLTVAKSVTPAFVQWQAAQKWNGVLPQMTGGAAMPFVNVGAIK